MSVGLSFFFFFRWPRIPLKAMKHAMVLTEPIEGMHSGLPNVRDHDLSVLGFAKFWCFFFFFFFWPY